MGDQREFRAAVILACPKCGETYIEGEQCQGHPGAGRGHPLTDPVWYVPESELARVREERDQLREEIAYLARFVERKHHPDGSSTTRVAPDGYTAAMLAVGIADAVDFARAVLGPEPEAEANSPKSETEEQ